MLGRNSGGRVSLTTLSYLGTWDDFANHMFNMLGRNSGGRVSLTTQSYLGTWDDFSNSVQYCMLGRNSGGRVSLTTLSYLGTWDDPLRDEFLRKHLEVSEYRLFSCPDCISTWGISKRLQRDVVYPGWPIAPSYMSPNAGGGRELRGLSQWVQLYTGAQINFGDLTPYLTYGNNPRGMQNRR